MERSELLAKFQWSNPWHVLAMGFGSGLSPWAPGTMGTLAAIPIYLLIMGLSLPFYVLLLIVTAVLGVTICDVTSKDLGVHDHGAIVWDEMVGFWLTMLAAPKGWEWIALGFVLFRFFDILKPWPIKVLDAKVHGGFGIMIDDVLAGVFALIGVQLVAWLVGA